MCGIMGVLGYVEPKTLYKLQMGLKIRGLHAFGVSYQTADGDLVTEKSFKPLPVEVLSRAIDGKALIFHNRYSTSGDYKLMQNNQPILTDHVSVALNGVISMKPRTEYEREYAVKCVTDNDTEILNRILEKGLNPAFYFNQSSASVSAVWIKGGNIYGYTNGKRPLHYIKIGKAVVVISTKDAVRRALGTEIPIWYFPQKTVISLEDLILC